MGPDVHPGPLTRASRSPKSGPRRSLFRDLLEAVLVAVVFALFVRTFLFQATAVSSESMEDTVLVGDHVLVNRFIFSPRAIGALAFLLPQRPVRRGDVFLFKFPNDPARDFVKRAIGVAGDLVEIRDKIVYVNGEPLAEPRMTHSDPTVYAAGRRDQFGPIRVSPGQIFALGDNRDRSNDSRFWGTVPVDNVLGRALFVYWSHAPGGSAKGLRRMLELFGRTRWDRTLEPVR
jgi:signal peptidase I